MAARHCPNNDRRLALFACLRVIGALTGFITPPSDNAAVSEAVWQKWLFFVGTVVRWLTVSKALGCASGAGEEQGAALLWKIATQRLKSEAESERAYLLNFE